MLSKKKFKYFIEKGFVSGWDDLRLATIRGIKRLGINMEALREYILMQGVPQKTSTYPAIRFGRLTKRRVDTTAARYFCVRQKDVVEVHISNKSEYLMEVPKHKKNGALEIKSFSIRIYYCYRSKMLVYWKIMRNPPLMNRGNAIVKSRSVVGEVVTRMELTLNLDGDFKTTKYKISWVSK